MAQVLEPQTSPVEETAAFYRLIAETIPHIVWSARGDGHADFFNQRGYDYTGLDAAQLQGWGWKAIVHPDDLQRSLESWTRALQTGERYEVEYRLRRHDGAYRWHHGSAVALRDAGGRPKRWFGTATDIESDVRSAQILESMVEQRSRDLLETERRFQLFMDHAPMMAWIRDSDLRYVYVNRMFERTLGCRLQDIVGRTAEQVHPQSDSTAYKEADLRVQREGVDVQFVDDFPQGIWLKVKFPYPDAAGGRGVAGIAIDISARVEAEEQARAYAADVRRLVERLISAQESERRRLADELHDLIGQNLTALGIDLATLKHKLNEAGNPVPGARIDTMRTLVEQTIRAIRGVMTDLRPPALEEFGLVPALRWYATEFTERTGMKAWVAIHGEECRLARETEFTLFRIVQEAMTNAAKHSGGSRVGVTLWQEAYRTRVSIEDDGSGFADPVGARSAHRGGWGLPTMRERAEAHGGLLRIEFPERGTRVVAEIPRSDGD